MSGKRKNKDDNWMPKRVYRGRSSYEYIPQSGSRKALVKLPKDGIETESIKAEVWNEYRKINENTEYNVAELIKDFHASTQFKRKGKRTQSDYLRYSEKVNIVFGKMKPSAIKPVHIRRFMDKLGETHEVTANRHHSYLSVLLSWALERDHCQTNPAKSVRKFKEEPRDRYVEQWEFDLVTKVAAESHYKYITPMMWIAYLCRMRPNEVRALCEHHITDKGVFVERGKGSENEITLWSPALRKAIADARSLHPNAPVRMERPLFHDKDGFPIKSEAFKTAWQRVMRKSIDAGLKERFTFHDLKARGITNHNEKFGGHKTKKMAKVYDRKPGFKDATE